MDICAGTADHVGSTVDEFAKSAPQDRRDIFNEAAVRLGGVDFTIAEKDFWVCWTLRVLFALGDQHPEMVFKGGTSLSKAYSLIGRFSEDIDVVTTMDFFVRRGAADPDEETSRSEHERRIEQLDADCRMYIARSLLPTLDTIFTAHLGDHDDWELSVDPHDRYGHTLLFRYPWSDPSREHEYIRGRVKIELGWRSATAPAEQRTIEPYVATFFPGLFTQPRTACRVLMPCRTFWEKATALHAESFRDEVPRFFSRHYSDVAALSTTDAGWRAIEDRGMLEAVRRFKQRYYASARARYDLAAPGTVRLLPSAAKGRALAVDYRAMRTMFFSEPPPFSQVLERLERVQVAING
jgi:hypothetical protein